MTSDRSDLDSPSAAHDETWSSDHGTSDPLRRDMRMLGLELRQVLHRHAESDLYDLVEQARQIASARQANQPEAEAQLESLIASRRDDQLGEMIRALACFLDLANLAEDRHRIRVLRERERTLAPAPQSESIGSAIQALHERGLDAAATQRCLDALDIELVFTAHPTEAKRRTVRNILNRLRADLIELDRSDLLPRERVALISRIRADLDCLWETDTVRPRKPTVIEEAQRSLFVINSLWQITPQLYRNMRDALNQYYPDHTFRVPLFLHFGSWIGGDRDGNPFVTPEVTHDVLKLLRTAALKKHIAQCIDLAEVLGVSERRHPITPALQAAITAAAAQWPDLKPHLEKINPNERYRQWLMIIRYRLQQTMTADLDEMLPPAAYLGAHELLQDIQLVGDSLRANQFDRLADGLLQDWLDRVMIFGFHLVRLDIREHSAKIHAAVAELMQVIDITPSYLDQSDAEKIALLGATIDPASRTALTQAELSPETRKLVELFRLRHRCVRIFGPDAIGPVIASMTHAASDVLAIHWLSRVAYCYDHDEAEGASHPEISPLFETIDDLKRAPEILDTLLQVPHYRDFLQTVSNRQICMIGYSDSTKDGGFLAANWYLHEAQRELSKIARQHGIELIFFHGRGGSLGRGGGPAARGILAQPPTSINGKLRVTEQGEVLAERYDDPEIAHRHLEQVTWATLLVSAKEDESIPADWLDLMRRAVTSAERRYRELLEDPKFIEYFLHATPIQIIESLPIGSRPSRRQNTADLSSLRAIPYTFAWTQARHGITAHYGLGSGLPDAAAGDWTTFQTMYQQWPLFRSIIDNAELGLAKCDTGLIRRYAALVPDQAAGQRLAETIIDEINKAKHALRQITGRDTLLEATSWLQKSIHVRNPYVDTLNFIQIELLRRYRRAAENTQTTESLEDLADLLRLSVQGVAAGLRTTG